MIERVIEERPYPYDPVLELIPGAYIEIYDDWGKDTEPAATIPCSDVLSAPLCMENQKLLIGDTASAEDVPSKREDTAITKAGMRSAMDSLIAKKMELEKQLSAVKDEIAFMDEKLSNAAKTLRLMNNNTREYQLNPLAYYMKMTHQYYLGKHCLERETH